MRVHRLIFRLDYQHPNFDIINGPGSVMRILADMGDKYWPEFQDDSTNRRVTTTHVDAEKGTFRQISVEPTMLNFTYESAAGVDINSLSSNETLITLFKGVRSLCEKFKISEIQRAGIRFFVLSSVNGGNMSLQSIFGQFIDAKLTSKVNSKLGEINDIGLMFDGNASDKLSYHLRFGPYEADEASKYFKSSTIECMAKSETARNLIFDIDLYEEKFLMTVNASKWSETPTIKAKQLITEIESYLSERT